ncbi:P pilus assembly protein, chaperone PapD [Dolichospermum sp. ST_con]|nr:P pilus assembly protein, chaperone PapD [Dolichospermum sp. ST_con]MDD1422351.1 P pilus assembly protein, chaperone PapD [Dolichospermum sp. ST_sed1]MDD1423687.1 P pilus assembly protein, chaperone PapD [Dolichospermum sp. ST_sed9]MDD1434524.1 P pilus assembly protein, chaperone PapD [Dolichospermum sp. ST_sed6]MDD1435809.1 P pilus assembly protein, chaperone PapD [Dolichospermum sp. ST_sed10]MDD1461533.1 P pilus assembly protein, chaperone PapD [Dolichospermum sp. ST_sed2]MDD1468569.1 P 
MKKNLYLPKLLANTLFCSSLLLGISLWQKPVNAQFRLSPMYIEMQGGQRKNAGSITIENTGSKPSRIRLFTTAFTYNQEGTFQGLSKGDTSDLTPYLQYSPKEMVLPPNTARNVRLVSILPPSLPDGEYRVAIFAETLTEVSNSDNLKIGIKANIGAAIYVRKGNLSPNLSLESAKFNPQNKELRLLVHNHGTATARPRIDWQLMQGEKEVSQGMIGSSFLPNSQVNLLLNKPDKLKSNLSPGTYQLRGKISWQQEGKSKEIPLIMDVSF